MVANAKMLTSIKYYVNLQQPEPLKFYIVRPWFLAEK